MRTTRPVPAPFDSATVVFSAVLMSVVTSRGGQRFCAADNLADLLGYLALASLIRLTSEVLDQLGGVVRGGLHRLAAGGLLRCRSLQKCCVDPGIDVLRQQVSEELFGVRLEFIQRRQAV